MAEGATWRAIAWLEGTDPEADGRFAAALAHDPQVAAALVEQARLSIDLRRAFDELTVEAGPAVALPRRSRRAGHRLPRRRGQRQRRAGRRLLIVGGLLLLLGIAVVRWSPWSAQPTGRWQVLAAVDAEQTGAALAPGQRLPGGAELSLPAGGSVELHSRDGHQLTLLGPARLRLAQSAAADCWLQQGSLACAIAPAPDGFRVRTPQAVISVLGTRFRVLVADERTDATVSEGQVRVRSTDGAEAVLQADQRLVVDGDGVGPVETVVWRAVAADGTVAPDCQHGGLLAGPTGQPVLRAQAPAADADPVQIVGAGTPFRGEPVLRMAAGLELRAAIRVDPAVAWYGLWLQDQDDGVHYYAHGGTPSADGWQRIRIRLSAAHPGGEPDGSPPALGDRIRAWRLQFGHPDALVLVRDLHLVQVAGE